MLEFSGRHERGWVCHDMCVAKIEPTWKRQQRKACAASSSHEGPCAAIIWYIFQAQNTSPCYKYAFALSSCTIKTCNSPVPQLRHAGASTHCGHSVGRYTQSDYRLLKHNTLDEWGVAHAFDVAPVEVHNPVTLLKTCTSQHAKLLVKPTRGSSCPRIKTCKSPSLPPTSKAGGAKCSAAELCTCAHTQTSMHGCIAGDEDERA